MDHPLASHLERIAVALEALVEMRRPRSRHAAPAPADDSVFDQLLAAFDGQEITLTQAREELGAHTISNKALSQMLVAAGFTRRRAASGMKYLVGDVKPRHEGAPLRMPPNLDQAVQAARQRVARGLAPMKASAVLHAAFRDAGAANPSVTDAHLVEFHRLYPGEFE